MTTWYVLRHELINTLRRTSFIVFGIVIPFAAALIFAGYKILRGRQESTPSSTPEPSIQLAVEGYVDLSGLIKSIPEDLPEGVLVGFSDEDQAKQALNQGEIDAYYLIPSDYLESGMVYLMFPNDAPLAGNRQDWLLRKVLLFNMLGGNPELADMVMSPMALQTISIATTPTEGENACSRPNADCLSSGLVRYTSVIFVALFYLTFMMSSSFLFQSVTIEKENRTIEVILSSITPRQMLAGKTLGLGIAGLIQTLCYLASIYIIFTYGGQTLNLPEGFHLPASTLIWAILFYLGGFGVYASLMAGVGALVPRVKEAGAANFIAIFPILVGYIVGLLAPFIGATFDLWVVILSMFPLTAPIVMVMRLLAGYVPLWQPVLALVLTLITAVWILRAVADMFQVQNLLSGQPFSLRRYFSSFRGLTQNR